MNILQCNVLCYNEKEQNLTGNSEDLWLPLSIDMDYVFAVKQNGAREYPTKAVIWHKSGDYFVIDVDYEDAVIKWIKSNS